MAKGCGMTVVGEYDLVAIRKAEDAALAKRSAEESGPVKSLYTPVVCVRRGLPLDQAATMHPEDLTPADAKFLVGKGVKLAAIGDLYGMNDGMAYAFMAKHGIKKAGVSEYPWTSVTVVKEPVPKTEPVKIRVLTPADLTREVAAKMLLDGVSKLKIRRRYGFPNDPACYLQLGKWGLHRKGLPTEHEQRQEEVRRMAQAVLEEIEREKMLEVSQIADGIRWHEDKPKTEITEAEKQDLLGDGLGEALPPIKLAPENLQYLKEVEDALVPEDDDGHIEDLVHGRAIKMPETQISDAVRQAAAAGEIKAETREVPLIFETLPPKKSDWVKDLYDKAHSTPAPTIDLASMHRFVPGPCGFGKSLQMIVISKEGTIRLSAGLVLAGPAEHRDPGRKFSAAVYVTDDGRTVVVHPEDGGAIFNGAKDGTAKKATAKPVINYLVELQIGLPATYQAQWSAVDGAWVGRLAEKVSA